MFKAFAEPSPADNAKDEGANEDDERDERCAAEEGPLDERPGVHLRVEHDAPADDVAQVEEEKRGHEQLHLAPDREPSLHARANVGQSSEVRCKTSERDLP